jgi:hypothetical protein
LATAAAEALTDQNASGTPDRGGGHGEGGDRKGLRNFGDWGWLGGGHK